MKRKLLMLVLLASAAPAHAQQWRADAMAGRIRSALDPQATSTPSIVLSGGYDDALTLFRVSGGVPTQSDEPLWGAVTGARRLVAPAGGFRFGVDLSGNAFVLHDRVERTQTLPGRGPFDPPQVVPGESLSGTAFAAQALPLLGFESAKFNIYGRAGLSYYTADFGGSSGDRTVRLADVQATFAPAPNFALVPVVRGYQDTAATYTYGGVTAIVAQGPVSVWGTVGTWLDVDNTETPWAAGATLRLNKNIALNASARRDAFDPLYRTPPQSSWNVGVSLQTGGSPLRGAPVPARYEGGRATVQLPAARAKTSQPHIAGDFNNWKPVPMQRSGKDWTYTVAVAPGVYNYAFVDDDGKWFVPADHPGRKDDGFGGHVAVLVVQQ